MPVQYLQGDITLDSADIIVNTVNCVGVAGKGVALAFKQRWPQIMMDYTDACHTKRLKPGKCLLFPHPAGHHNRFWAAFATKNNWKDPSQYSWIASGLFELHHRAHLVNAKSIAIPPPGCGNGQLDWSVVRPMVVRALGEFDLRIYGSN